MDTSIEPNAILNRLPKHLKQFIKPQNYSRLLGNRSGSLALCDA